MWAVSLACEAQRGGPSAQDIERQTVKGRARGMLARMVPFEDFASDHPSSEEQAEYRRVRAELEAVIRNPRRRAVIQGRR